MISWYFSLAILLGIGLTVYFRTGPRQAIAAVAMLGYLVAQWVQLDPHDPTLRYVNVLTAATVVMLALYPLHSQATFDMRLRPCDWLLIAMMLVHLASDVQSDGFRFSILFRIYGEWF